MLDNKNVADRLMNFARQLEKEQGNLYRIKAYRRAAETIERLAIPLAKLVEEKGVEGLRRLPGIGDHLSFAIERLVTTGDFHALTLDHDNTPPEEDVRTLRGVGPHLAELLWEKLHVRTIAELEQAIQENRLEQLPLGEKRRQQLRDLVEKRTQQTAQIAAPANEPSVAELLRIDEEYRRLAKNNRLPTIAPERFNPFQESWLPLFAARRGGYKYRAMFSNTALAHRLGQTRDWVVIYFSNDTHQGQRTVVTEKRGSLRGRRVVRGRERECQEYYQGRES